MTSPAQIAANRNNSKFSTGPTSEAGKRASSRNALKHGLTAREIVLPGEDPEAYAERLNLCLDYHDVDDPLQAGLIERAVGAKWKLDRCTRVETERLSEKVRHADDHYDLEKFTEAQEIGRRLVFEPFNRCQNAQIHDPVVRARVEQRTRDNPAVLTRQLQTFAQGVDWLISQWTELGEMLRQHKYWHYPEKFRAIWLLGRRPEDFLEDLTVQRIYLAANVAHPDTHDTDPDCFDLQDECIQAKLGIQGRPMYFEQVNEIRRYRPADKLTAQALLWDVFTKEITRLRELKYNHLDPLADADRAGAQTRAMFDDSKEAVLLRRYETACEREFHRSIADFSRLRKESARDDRPRSAVFDDRPAPEPEAEPAPAEIGEPAASTEVDTDEQVTTCHPHARRVPRNEAIFSTVDAPEPSKNEPSDVESVVRDAESVPPAA